MSDPARTGLPDRSIGGLGTDRLAVRIAIVIAIGMVVGSAFSVWNEARFGGPVARVPVGTDFATFHGMASLVVEGHADQIYTPEVLGAKLSETTGYEQITSQTYGGPPFSVLFFLPFGLVGFELGYVLFAVGGAIVLSVAVSRLGGAKPAHAVGLALVSIPGFATLHLGQLGLWAGALLLAVYLAMRRTNLFGAGLMLGLLALKPFYAIGVAVWWLLGGRRNLRALAGAGCSAAALVVAGFVIPGGWSGYLAVLDSSGDQFLTGVAKSGFSLFDMWSTLLPDSMVASILWAATAIVCVVVFGRMIRRAAHQLEISFAMAVVLGLLISPRIGWYDWVLLVVPAVLLWGAMPERRDDLVLAGAWLFPTAALSWPVARWIENVSGVYLQVAPMVLAGVTWWLFKGLLRQREISTDGLDTDAVAPQRHGARIMPINYVSIK